MKTDTKGKTPNSNIPLGVKIISILGYIISFSLIFRGGYLVIKNLYVFKEIIRIAPWLILFSIPITLFFLLIGIILTLIGIFWIFISRGLWKLKNWARIAVLIFAGIFILVVPSFLSLPLYKSILLVIPGIVILFYLILNKRVKEAFND